MPYVPYKYEVKYGKMTTWARDQDHRKKFISDIPTIINIPKDPVLGDGLREIITYHLKGTVKENDFSYISTTNLPFDRKIFPTGQIITPNSSTILHFLKRNFFTDPSTGNIYSPTSPKTLVYQFTSDGYVKTSHSSEMLQLADLSHLISQYDLVVGNQIEQIWSSVEKDSEEIILLDLDLYSRAFMPNDTPSIDGFINNVLPLMINVVEMTGCGYEATINPEIISSIIDKPITSGRESLEVGIVPGHHKRTYVYHLGHVLYDSLIKSSHTSTRLMGEKLHFCRDSVPLMTASYKLIDLIPLDLPFDSIIGVVGGVVFTNNILPFEPLDVFDQMVAIGHSYIGIKNRDGNFEIIPRGPSPLTSYIFQAMEESVRTYLLFFFRGTQLEGTGVAQSISYTPQNTVIGNHWFGENGMVDNWEHANIPSYRNYISRNLKSLSSCISVERISQARTANQK